MTAVGGRLVCAPGGINIISRRTRKHKSGRMTAAAATQGWGSETPSSTHCTPLPLTTTIPSRVILCFCHHSCCCLGCRFTSSPAWSRARYNTHTIPGVCAPTDLELAPNILNSFARTAPHALPTQLRTMKAARMRHCAQGCLTLCASATQKLPTRVTHH